MWCFANEVLSAAVEGKSIWGYCSTQSVLWIRTSNQPKGVRISSVLQIAFLRLVTHFLFLFTPGNSGKTSLFKVVFVNWFDFNSNNSNNEKLAVFKAQLPVFPLKER